MFKRKPKEQPRHPSHADRRPTRLEYANVTPVYEARYESPEQVQRAIERLENKTRRRIIRAVERFLDSPEIEDLAKVNDLFLRAYLKVPAQIRATRGGENFLRKMVRMANDAMAHKVREAQELGDQVLLQKTLYAREELSHKLDYLGPSIRQLAGFVSSQAHTHPERAFATGVNLDVRYGIDLIGVDAAFDGDEGALVVDLNIYQAKAARGGMGPAEIQSLPQRYRRTTELLERDFTFDADWVKRYLLRSPGFDSEEGERFLEEEQALEILTGELEELAKVRHKLNDMSVQERYEAEMRMYRTLRTFADEFDCELPEDVNPPNIKLRSVEQRFLVDTRKGTADLSVDEAEHYT